MLGKDRRRFAYPWQYAVKCIVKQNLIKIDHVVCAFSLTNHDRPRGEALSFFAYQCKDNVKLYKQAKFDENIPFGSRVMSLFTKRAQPANMMLGEASSTFCIPMAGQC